MRNTVIAQSGGPMSAINSTVKKGRWEASQFCENI